MKAIIRLMAVAIVLSAVCPGVFAEPLNPPPGPVQPTGRVQINQQYYPALPILIDQPGSYVLTSNIVGDGTTGGIEIASNDVTLDLNGFALRNVIPSEGGGGFDAIRVLSPGKGVFYKNIAIRNGNIDDWGGSGIDFTNATNVEIENVRVYSCNVGIFGSFNAKIRDCETESNSNRGIMVGNTCVIDRCTAIFNGFGGFLLGSNCSVNHCVAEVNSGIGFDVGGASTLSYCTSQFNFQPKGFAAGYQLGDGCSASGCTANNNGGTGFSMFSRIGILNCVSSNNSGHGYEGFDNLSFTNSSANGNGNNGFYFDSGTVTGCSANNNAGGIYTFFLPATIVNCDASNNFFSGIQLTGASTVRNCTTSNNGFVGIEATLGGEASTITGCTAFNNIDDGIQTVDGCIISGNTCYRNHSDGIQTTGACRIENNHCNSNGSVAGGVIGSGILVTGGRCRIDGNSVGDNDRGIEITGTNNKVVRNSAHANLNDYGAIAGGNDVGPVGSAAASTSPWANLQ